MLQLPRAVTERRQLRLAARGQVAAPASPAMNSRRRIHPSRKISVGKHYGRSAVSIRAGYRPALPRAV